MHFPTLIVAGLLLFFGRKLYWLFVACVGFLAGLHFGSALVLEPAWSGLAIGILCGIVGAILAIFFQRIAVGIAGFLAGGQLGLILAHTFNFGGESTELIAYAVCGVLVALLVMMLLDWALIVVSSLLGVGTIIDVIQQPQNVELLLFFVLLAFGIAVQAFTLRGSLRARAVQET